MLANSNRNDSYPNVHPDLNPNLNALYVCNVKFILEGIDLQFSIYFTYFIYYILVYESLGHICMI